LAAVVVQIALARRFLLVSDQLFRGLVGTDGLSNARVSSREVSEKLRKSHDLDLQLGLIESWAVIAGVGAVGRASLDEARHSSI
jgi:hypothetical protein